VGEDAGGGLEIEAGPAGGGLQLNPDPVERHLLRRGGMVCE